jgi:hypothetical protein
MTRLFVGPSAGSSSAFVGVEYDIISDSARVGYELGKGPWGDFDFADFVRVGDASKIAAFLINEYRGLWESEYCGEIANAVVAFAAAHPDWRIVNDCSCDITVADDEEWQRLVEEEGENPYDADFPIYKQVGSRYRGPAGAVRNVRER